MSQDVTDIQLGPSGFWLVHGCINMALFAWSQKFLHREKSPGWLCTTVISEGGKKGKKSQYYSVFEHKGPLLNFSPQHHINQAAICRVYSLNTLEGVWRMLDRSLWKENCVGLTKKRNQSNCLIIYSYIMMDSKSGTFPEIQLTLFTTKCCCLCLRVCLTCMFTFWVVYIVNQPSFLLILTDWTDHYFCWQNERSSVLLFKWNDFFRSNYRLEGNF